jgi:hypothetical protein
MRNRTLIIALLSTATLFGCKKKDKEAEPAAMDKMAESADKMGSGSAATAPDKMAPPAGDTKGSADEAKALGISSSDDYMKKATEMTGYLTAALKDADCGKTATALTMLNTEHAADVKALDAWAKAHPDDEKKFEGGPGKVAMDAMTPVMEKCKDDPAFKDAMSKMPN